MNSHSLAEFYLIGDVAYEDLQRCQDSQREQRQVTETGATTTGEARLFTGVVQSIAHNLGAPEPQRWRISLLEC